MWDLVLTLAGFALCAGLAIYANWKMAQPWNDLKPKRVPWGIVMIFAIFLCILLLAHLAGLAGIKTGVREGPFARF